MMMYLRRRALSWSSRLGAAAVMSTGSPARSLAELTALASSTSPKSGGAAVHRPTAPVRPHHTVPGFTHLPTGRHQRVLVHAGDLRRVRHVPEPLGQDVRAGERLLQRNLLIKDHPDHQGERILVEQGVRLGLLAEHESHPRRLTPPATKAPPSRAVVGCAEVRSREPPASGRAPRSVSGWPCRTWTRRR